MNEKIIANKYKIIKKIGEGSFGVIYQGKNIRTNEAVAVKIEVIQNKTYLLKNESIIYQYLSKQKGIPTIKWFGKDDDHYYMVLNLLGKSLENLKDEYGRFSLKIVLQIGIKLIHLIESIHSKAIIHRDIKPDNFLFGLNHEKNEIFIIDFGFCKSYIQDGQHIQKNKISNIIGSPNYISLNAHDCYETSRKDDLESLGYILLYLYFGSLEWQNTRNLEEMKNMKIDTIQNKNKNIPIIIQSYLKEIHSLTFEQKPNYNFLLNIMEEGLLICP